MTNAQQSEEEKMEGITERFGLEKTDPRRWRLVTDPVGTQQWRYLWSKDTADKWPQALYDKYALGLDLGLEKLPSPKTDLDAARNAARFLSKLQLPSGQWACVYDGPMFLMIGVVACYYIANIPLPEEMRIEFTRYLVNKANPVDGGWGLHSEDKSTVFGTSVNYVILRLAGMEADHPVAVKARNTLHAMGGAIGAPHWGKAYLALLNLYGWEGVNPVPPEFWLLPYCLPFHPGRWWTHTRAVYLPMGYLYANKNKANLDPLLQSLREEIYVGPFKNIDFSRHRNTVSAIDVYYPHSKLLDFTNNILDFWSNKLVPRWVTKTATNEVWTLIEKELHNTEYGCIGPVNIAMNAIVTFYEKGEDSFEFEKVFAKLQDYLYMTPDGMCMNGTDGVQVWDTSLALQFLVESGLAEEPEFRDVVERAYLFLVRSQISEEAEPGSYRDSRKGTWPFSKKSQGYCVSDCTAEAMSAVLMVQSLHSFSYLRKELTEEKLHPTIDVLLSLQNREQLAFGSFASYEKIRTQWNLESLNPAEVFGNIMTEYPYVECTDSSVLGLSRFRDAYPYRRHDVNQAINDGCEYIRKFQAPDGGWYGSWGVCFSYAHMFAIEALSFQGETYQNSETVRKGCDFFIWRQNEDGGWGESIRSTETCNYVPETHSQVVQTSWIILALLFGNYPNKSVIDKAIRYLRSQQLPDGGFPQQEMEGVFNQTCMIRYPNYKLYFPIKALSLYYKTYGNK